VTPLHVRVEPEAMSIVPQNVAVVMLSCASGPEVAAFVILRNVVAAFAETETIPAQDVSVASVRLDAAASANVVITPAYGLQ